MYIYIAFKWFAQLPTSRIVVANKMNYLPWVSLNHADLNFTKFTISTETDNFRWFIKIKAFFFKQRETSKRKHISYLHTHNLQQQRKYNLGSPIRILVEQLIPASVFFNSICTKRIIYYFFLLSRNLAYLDISLVVLGFFPRFLFGWGFVLYIFFCWVQFFPLYFTISYSEDKAHTENEKKKELWKTLEHQLTSTCSSHARTLCSHTERQAQLYDCQAHNRILALLFSPY